MHTHNERFFLRHCSLFFPNILDVCFFSFSHSFAYFLQTLSFQNGFDIFLRLPPNNSPIFLFMIYSYKYPRPLSFLFESHKISRTKYFLSFYKKKNIKRCEKTIIYSFLKNVFWYNTPK